MTENAENLTDQPQAAAELGQQAGIPYAQPSAIEPNALPQTWSVTQQAYAPQTGGQAGQAQTLSPQIQPASTPAIGEPYPFASAPFTNAPEQAMPQQAYAPQPTVYQPASQYPYGQQAYPAQQGMAAQSGAYAHTPQQAYAAQPYQSAQPATFAIPQQAGERAAIAAQRPTAPFGTAAPARAIAEQPAPAFDFNFVNSTARIALYDNLRSAPRVTEIQPNTTAEYIENLASKVYEQAKLAGGTIPYTVIREVSENFIHARFTEATVSIFDGGNTIRFADQGPGIHHKEKAQLPGFTSAIEPMKRYIRGVGSGLPIVREYLELSHGTISIEDNLGTGAVVTISLEDNPSGQTAKPLRGGGAQSSRQQALAPELSQREKDFLALFLDEGALGVTDLVKLTDLATSSTHATLKKLEEHGLVEKTTGQKRILTDLGFHTATNLK